MLFDHYPDGRGPRLVLDTDDIELVRLWFAEGRSRAAVIADLQANGKRFSEIASLIHLARSTQDRTSGYSSGVPGP